MIREEIGAVDFASIQGRDVRFGDMLIQRSCNTEVELRRSRVQVDDTGEQDESRC